MLSIYPLTRLIEYGRFFQRIDAFFILFWILAAFSYISTNVILALNVFKKISLIKSTKALAPCFTVIVLGFSLCMGSMADFKFFSEVVHKYYTIGLIFIITPIVYIGAYLKKTKKEGVIN